MTCRLLKIAEVRAQVGAVGVHQARLSGLGPKQHQVTVEVAQRRHLLGGELVEFVDLRLDSPDWIVGDRFPVDLGELCLSKFQIANRACAIDHLFWLGCPDQRGGDAAIAKHPGNRHLSQGLPAFFCNTIQFANAFNCSLSQKLRQ